MLVAGAAAANCALRWWLVLLQPTVHFATENVGRIETTPLTWIYRIVQGRAYTAISLNDELCKRAGLLCAGVASLERSPAFTHTQRDNMQMQSHA